MRLQLSYQLTFPVLANTFATVSICCFCSSLFNILTRVHLGSFNYFNTRRTTMPLFGNRQRSAERDAPVYDNRVDDRPNRKGSIFSRNRSTSPTHYDERDNTHNRTNGSGGSFFNRRRSSSSSGNSRQNVTRDGSRVAGSTNTGSGLFGNRNGRTLHNPRMSKDPSIIAARQRITDAEEAERSADQALLGARAAVRAAKEHCKMLEREAEEE